MSNAVVVATYNGEKYIQEQLQSILDQTMQPDVVYIYDDASTDSTTDIITDFIKKNHLKTRWHLYINTKNLGWKVNFHNALLLCPEDIIFPCDQDDIWEINKVEIMYKAMIRNEEIGLLAGSYSPFYEDEKTRKIAGFILNTMNYDNKIKRIELDEKFAEVLRPGCTYSVRRSFLQDIKDIWYQEYAHDMNLWTAGILLGKAYLIDTPVIKWRRYDESSSNPLSNKADVNKYQLYLHSKRKHMEENTAYFKRLLKNELFTNKSKMFIRNELERERLLLNGYVNKKALPVCKAYIKYRSYFVSPKSFFTSLALIFINKFIRDSIH